GKVPAGAQIAARARASDPPPLAPRRVDYVDARAGKPVLRRYYVTPSYVTAGKGEAEALDLLMKIASSGSTSRLYRKLVVEQKLASNAGGYYHGSGLDSGKIALYAVPADGVSLDTLERAMDAVIEDIKANGVTDAEVVRARKSYIAEYIYESDSQTALARRYGWGLVVGQTVADIDTWPAELAKITAADIKAAAARWLDLKRSVTGRLLPEASQAAAPSAAPAGRS
ncbi:MAG: insulinase family protein, partial [Hyphomicrobiaceae bacterium]